MPKLDTSIYKGFLNTLEKARESHYLVTMHFFRDPTVRGYISEIDKEVYTATIESEEGNCFQIRLSQITSLSWKKNGTEEIKPSNEQKTNNRKRNLAIMKDNREKMETESALEYMKKNPTEADKKEAEKNE